MKTILAKTPCESSFSLSKRFFHWKKKVLEASDEENDDHEEIPRGFTRLDGYSKIRPDRDHKKKKEKMTKFQYVLAVFRKARPGYQSGLGRRVVGTLFGHRRGYVCFAVQDDPTRLPAVLVELPISTAVLVRQMAAGLVRIALECEKRVEAGGLSSRKGSKKLLEESAWRTYCNGQKCGFAARRDCATEEWLVLLAVGPTNMGAGVLPAAGGGYCGEGGNGAVGSEKGELMYMRARFERVVGSRDSEAFYMMNPEGTGGGPELSVYLRRV